MERKTPGQHPNQSAQTEELYLDLEIKDNEEQITLDNRESLISIRPTQFFIFTKFHKSSKVTNLESHL